jgi:hypothetical protein
MKSRKTPAEPHFERTERLGPHHDASGKQHGRPNRARQDDTGNTGEDQQRSHLLRQLSQHLAGLLPGRWFGLFRSGRRRGSGVRQRAVGRRRRRILNGLVFVHRSVLYDDSHTRLRCVVLVQVLIGEGHQFGCLMFQSGVAAMCRAT